MKPKAVTAMLVTMMSWQATATPIEIDTTLWSSELSPSHNRLSSTERWLGLEDNNPNKQSNSSGTLVSDFVLNGDFQFTGVFSPTYATNGSCAAENTCDDDDILGLVFGWQDASNHYRLGWSQGDGTNKSGVKDITGRTGLFLIKEEDGRSNTIANWKDVFWQENVLYKFSISRAANTIAFMIEGLVQNIRGIQGATIPTASPVKSELQVIDFEVEGTSFTTGRVGVYTESQSANFSLLSVTTAQVSGPVTLGLFALGGIALMLNGRRKVDALEA